ncbi:MAG TPA: relaxase/mobilization nuclease domain-containing protein [Stellaceae bacterium]|nr:relaxase/mobilization nuclease domain-containing protein [Stellaceae bacterium]
MIIKGKSRAGPQQLATHLGNAEKNERVSLIETRGTVAQDLRGALVEMDAYAIGTKCERALYHAAISPEPPHLLSPEQRTEAIDALETKLGLDGHARLVVMHEKLGRQHIHVVWSRIDLEKMRSVSDSHNYRKHEEVARDLERRFGHDRVQGAHHERDGVARPDRTPSRAELQQQERTGITGRQVKEEVTAAFQASDGAEAFRAALQERGYTLARGDRRDYVILDQKGGIHSLVRRIDGMKAAELREFMAALDPESVPNIEQARELIAERDRRTREAMEAHSEALTERDYSRGDDYVSQSRAALRDHQRRREALDDRSAGGREERPARPTKDDRNDKGEMTDARQRRLDRLAAINEELNRARDRTEDDPDKQREAPGGGHTRSR